MPELPEVEALRRSLDDPGAGISDRASRARAHCDPEDVRPAAGGAGGTPACRRRAARQAAALPDRGRRARSARAPDVCGPRALPARGRGRPEEAGVQAGLRGRRPARPDRGRREEARGRLAADARAGRPGARAPGPGSPRPRRGATRRDPGGRAPPAALAPARPAADRRDRPRLGQRDPAHRGPVPFRHGPGSDPGTGPDPRGGDRLGALARPRATRARREGRERLPRPQEAARALPRLRNADRAGRLRAAHDLLLPEVSDRTAACSKTGACRASCGSAPRIASIQPAEPGLRPAGASLRQKLSERTARAAGS